MCQPRTVPAPAPSRAFGRGEPRLGETKARPPFDTASSLAESRRVASSSSGSGTVGRGRKVERVHLVELQVEDAPVLRAFLSRSEAASASSGQAILMSSWLGADRYPVFHLDPN